MSYGSKVRFFSSTNEENQSKLSGGARNAPQRRLERAAAQI
jgi:hypothetical protein